MTTLFKFSSRIVLVSVIVLIPGILFCQEIFQDDFNKTHDFIKDSIAGTIWDGILVNSGVDKTQDSELHEMNTSVVPGSLFIRSSNSDWEMNEDDGVFLYKIIDANKDFDVSVMIGPKSQFTSMEGLVYFNSGGLMVKHPEADLVDFINILAFDMAGRNAVHLIKDVDGGNQNGPIFGDAKSIKENPWLRITRKGSTFTTYYGPDGVIWEKIYSTNRKDLMDTPLLVGIVHAAFSPNITYVEYDNFKLHVAGSSTKTASEISSANIRAAENLNKTLSKYKGIKGYRDNTIINTRIVESQGPSRNISNNQFYFAFSRPNQVRYEVIVETRPGSSVELFCNGEKIISYLANLNQYTEKEAPHILMADSLGNIESYLLKYIFSDTDPTYALDRDNLEVKAAESDYIGDLPINIIELKQPLHISNYLPPGQLNGNIMIPVKFWVGENDNLIYEISYEIDMESMLKSLYEGQEINIPDNVKGMKLLVEETHRHIEIDPAFSNRAFTFTPPEGSQLVEEFIQPVVNEPEKESLIGNPAPGFTLKDIDGNEVSLSDFKGKVVLIDFWATWCSPCIRSIPQIQALHEIYKEEGLVILGINSWEQGENDLDSFLKENNITYRILLDSDDKVIGEYQVRGIPTTFLIDKNGIISHSTLGLANNSNIIQRYIEELLAK